MGVSILNKIFDSNFEWASDGIKLSFDDVKITTYIVTAIDLKWSVFTTSSGIDCFRDRKLPPPGKIISKTWNHSLLTEPNQQTITLLGIARFAHCLSVGDKQNIQLRSINDSIQALIIRMCHYSDIAARSRITFRSDTKIIPS